jgi:hypothetical protein
MVLLNGQAYSHPRVQLPAEAFGPSPSPSSLSTSPLPMPTMPGGGGDARAVVSPMALLLQAEEELRRRAMAAAAAAPTTTARAAPAAAALPASVAAVAPHPQAFHVGLGPLALPSATPPDPPSSGPLAGDVPLTVLPGVTGARVGMLSGLRTPHMLKFNGVRASRGDGAAGLWGERALRGGCGIDIGLTKSPRAQYNLRLYIPH